MASNTTFLFSPNKSNTPTTASQNVFFLIVSIWGENQSPPQIQVTTESHCQQTAQHNVRSSLNTGQVFIAEIYLGGTVSYPKNLGN